jgi:hypothetical protein
MQSLIESFVAFNENGINNLIYSFSANWWLIFTVIGAIGSAAMGLKEESVRSFREEQNIL